MGLTFTYPADWFGQESGMNKARIQIDFDTSYPNGTGETINATDVGMADIYEVRFQSSVGGYDFYTETSLPATSVAVKVRCPSGGDTAPAAVGAPALGSSGIFTTAVGGADHSSITLHTHVASSITAGRGIEMGDTADLSSLTGIWVTVLGY